MDDAAMPTPPSSGGRTPTKPRAEPPGHRRTHTPAVSSPNPLRLANAKRPGPPAPSASPTPQRLPSPAPASSSSSSPLQEPGSAQYLDRLLRLVRCRRACSSSIMADFLASFNLGAQTPAASSNPQCDSVQDLQLHLRGALDAKVTPNRAEHLSITIELRATVRFQLAASEPENGALENLNNGDPSLGGMSVAADLAPPRVVFANDTLMNQPHDDPALQRSVAKHIISLVSLTDGSTWTVREVSRGSQGWTFTYLCKDSFQQWRRQTAKNPTKAVVGEFSQRDPDPTLHARPAFDCRGCVTIAFNRNSRAITVKYDHTPMHKTVAELAEYFKPPPRQLGPGAQKLQQQKTKEKTPKKAKGEKRERKKRESTKAQDENGNPRKRKKKNNGAAQPTAQPDGPMIPPDYPGAPPIDGQVGPSYAAGEQLDGSAAQNQQGFSDYPQGLMGDSAAVANGSTTQTGNQPASVTYPVNVSAAEAARRREAALTMLSNAGVEPSTLSAEQFNIFSNQAPELQRESLGMLVKYGAERLRIVHPGNREGSAQTNASTSTPSSQTTPSGPITTKELVPQSGAQSNGGTDNEAPVEVDAAEASGTKKGKRKKMAKSRTACFPCKARKTKCPRERPTCTECESHGTTCEYAQKPRNKKKKPEKSEPIVVEDDEDEDEDEEEQQQEEPEEETPDQEDSVQQDTSQDYSYPQMNIGNMVTTTDTTSQDLQGPQNGYYQPTSGMSLPQPDPYSNSQQPLTADPGLVMSPRQTYSTMPEVTQPPPPAPAPAGTIAPIESRRWTAIGPGNKARRSLPSEPVHTNGQTVAAPNPQPSDWAQSTNDTMPATTVSSVSPQMAYSRSANTRSRQVNQNVSQDPQMTDGLQQARQSPVAAAAMMAQARKSPYQQAAVPRAASRQSHRNQSRTPVDQTRGYQPPADMSHQHNTRSSTHHDTTQMTGASGYSEYGRYGSTNTAASHQSSHRGYDHTSSTTMQQNADTSSQTAAMAMSMASGTPSTMSTAYPATTSSASQWPGSSGRNDRSYGSNSSYHGQSAYSQQPAASSKSVSASRQNFSMRSSTQQDTCTSSSKSNSYGQQQQQQPTYPSYSGPTQQSQAGNQQQQPSWYFQNSHNSSLQPGSQSSGYSYESWSGV